jgi:hypothetical protein
VRGREGQPAKHAFVDESFAGDYLVAAAILRAEHVSTARQAVRQLLDRQQRRIHFKDESSQRKQLFLNLIAGFNMDARVYLTPNRSGPRERCLERMIVDLGRQGVTRLLIERADSLVARDRRTIYRVVRDTRLELEYDHLRAHEELLLCVADAVAWCAAKGGPWRERIQPFTTTIRL